MFEIVVNQTGPGRLNKHTYEPLCLVNVAGAGSRKLLHFWIKMFFFKLYVGSCFDFLEVAGYFLIF